MYPYCWWKKSCTSWYGKYPILYGVVYIPGGAGFLPSTAVHLVACHCQTIQVVFYESYPRHQLRPGFPNSTSMAYALGKMSGRFDPMYYERLGFLLMFVSLGLQATLSPLKVWKIQPNNIHQNQRLKAPNDHSNILNVTHHLLPRCSRHHGRGSHMWTAWRTATGPGWG